MAATPSKSAIFDANLIASSSSSRERERERQAGKLKSGPQNDHLFGATTTWQFRQRTADGPILLQSYFANGSLDGGHLAAGSLFRIGVVLFSRRRIARESDTEMDNETHPDPGYPDKFQSIHSWILNGGSTSPRILYAHLTEFVCFTACLTTLRPYVSIHL